MRLGILTALATGYVLGSRAGRERYEQIRALAGSAAQRLEAYGSTGPLATSLGRSHRSGGTDGDLAAGRGRQSLRCMCVRCALRSSRVQAISPATNVMI